MYDDIFHLIYYIQSTLFRGPSFQGMVVNSPYNKGSPVYLSNA